VRVCGSLCLGGWLSGRRQMRQLIGVEARQSERIDTLEARVATLESSNAALSEGATSVAWF
jgi:hypothetical protein